MTGWPLLLLSGAKFSVARLANEPCPDVGKSRRRSGHGSDASRGYLPRARDNIP